MAGEPVDRGDDDPVGVVVLKGIKRIEEAGPILRTVTTTYHFGRTESICGEVPNDEATTMTLDEALDEGRRLCVLCGRLVEKWVGYSTAVASATSLVPLTASPDEYLAIFPAIF